MVISGAGWSLVRVLLWRTVCRRGFSESLLCEFIPFLDRILVPFDMFPYQGGGASRSEFNAFINDVIFGAEACDGETVVIATPA